MAGFLAAWLAGMALYAWRSFHVNHHMPVPGAMLGITGLFAVLAIIGDLSPQARFPVTALAWALNLAALMNLLPEGLGGQITAAETASEQAVTPTGATGRMRQTS